MSSLVSLQVLGVRSFGPDPEDVGTVKFLSPITLILGKNGCGKTTLIESLKFATCGEVPENTNRGKDFLYNPHLAQTTDTRAFVKLKFIDINGDSLVVTRPMQISQKLKNLEFKRLDHAIKLTKPSGESTSLSSRCTDIDNLVTSSLGVSKAILTNVIFCHQEDSSWPLDEGKKVKERFDAIFDAKKYNVCLVNIKKIRKERMVDLKVMKNDLQYMGERKEQASIKRASLSESEDRMTAILDQVKSLRDKIAPIASRLREIAEKEDSIGRLRTEYETNTTRLESVQEIIQDLKSRIKSEFSGTDEELEDALTNFQAEFISKKGKLKQLDNDLLNIDSEMKQKNNEIKREEQNVSLCTRDNDRYLERVECRNKMLVDLCRKLSIETTAQDESFSCQSQVSRIVNLIENGLQEKQDDLTDMKSENEAIINELQNQIDLIREEKVKTESMIKHKKEVIVNTHKECDKLKKTINEVDKSADSLGQLDRELKLLKNEYENLNSNYNIDNMNSEIKEKKEERNKLEAEMVILENEIKSVQKSSGINTEINLKKQTKESKEDEIKKLQRRHRESLNQLLGSIPEIGLKMKFQSCLTSMSDAIKDKRDQLKKSEKEVTKLELEKKHLLDKLRKTREDLTKDECMIDQECGNKNYDSCLSELSSKIQEFHDQKGTLSSSEYMFKKYIQKLEQKDPSCPVCNREFSNEEEVHSLVMDLNFNMRELPSKIRNSKEKLEETEEKYKKLLQLKPKFEKLSFMKDTEIPSIQTDLEKIDQKFDVVKQKTSQLQTELDDLLRNEELAKNIQGDVITLEQLLNDVKKLEKEIKELESKLPPETQKYTMDEALQEQELLRSKISHVRKFLDDIQGKLNSVSSRKQQLQEEINSIQSQQMEISGNAQMRSQLVEKLNENQTSLSIIQTEIDKLKDELLEHSTKLDKASENIKSQVSANNKTLQDAISELQVVDQKFKECQDLSVQIDRYVNSGGPEKITSAQQKVATLSKRLNKLSETKEVIVKELEGLKHFLASQQSSEKDLQDNIKLRAKMTEEKDLTEKIKSLQSVIGRLDYVSITVEKNKLRQEEENIMKEKARAEGRQRELDTAISNIKTELEKDIYKNADKNYKNKLTEIKVEEAVIDDLNKYYVALDWALTHFHQEKMKAINSSIRDLWREIYQGNDIDSIEIKADVDSSASADKRRTYNYRVVQVKNGVEMLMRGRCSAGQKVLACLIIRMALAETFSANCGVLALDEPTTNLDQSNIHSLSQALVNIVNHRSQQNNFQLIIISHDKAFLEVLQQIDRARYYYNITRNHLGRSRIEKISVHDKDINGN